MPYPIPADPERIGGDHFVWPSAPITRAGPSRRSPILSSRAAPASCFWAIRRFREVRARLDGYLRALASAGVSRSAGLEVPVRFGSEAAYDGVSSLLNAHVEFDGVFACSDVIAMSAMRALTERGRRVPADVAVVGFDDISLAAYTTPPLTTVRQDCMAGARMLLDKLLQIGTGQRVESEVIPTELVVRASSLRQHHQQGASQRRRPTVTNTLGRPGSR